METITNLEMQKKSTWLQVCTRSLFLHTKFSLVQIILGDGGHHGTGYVTPTSAVQPVSKLWKLFDLMTSRWPIKFTKSAPSFEK